MHRVTRNVIWARPCERPSGIPRVSRARGSRAKGLAYERALARALRRTTWMTAQHGQWFVYGENDDTLMDDTALTYTRHYCQPDFVCVSPSTIHVLECKLTNVEEATEQLLDLYFPVLSRAYNRPVRGIIVVRSVHRVPICATIVPSLHQALVECEKRVPVWHWIGKGPL